MDYQDLDLVISQIINEAWANKDPKLLRFQYFPQTIKAVDQLLKALIKSEARIKPGRGRPPVAKYTENDIEILLQTIRACKIIEGKNVVVKAERKARSSSREARMDCNERGNDSQD